MKRFAGWMMASAVAIMAGRAHAQVPAPYEIGRPAVVVSDLSGPYAAMAPEAGPDYGGPRLVPRRDVYAVARDGGFSPLSAPQQRGFVYTIAVINPDGDDGRLVIDAHDGRILRFMPAEWTRDSNDDLTATYGPVGPPPVVIEARRGPRPPAPIRRHYASRSPSYVPLPKAAPHAVVAPNHVVAKPKPAAAPAQQSAAVETKPKSEPAAPAADKPAVTIEPTRDMPPVQGFN
ncbi:MAG TPA: hypothetical protein VHC94_20955 [Nitrobacter sp.]|nr:hypothetical protein [Nitrobacter sp.]